MRDAVSPSDASSCPRSSSLPATARSSATVGTAHYMAGYGVPGILLPLVILLELGGGIALLIGWQTRWAALAPGIFSVLAVIIFHHQVGDGMQKILPMCELAFTGGLFVLSAAGAGHFSLNGRAERYPPSAKET